MNELAEIKKNEIAIAAIVTEFVIFAPLRGIIPPR